jgi:hypothetical protein
MHCGTVFYTYIYFVVRGDITGDLLLVQILCCLGRIRRISMFSGLPDPDPLVRGTVPDQDPLPFSQKGVERTEIMK